MVKNSNTTEIVEKEHHPNWYFPIPDMRTLVLGTFPPHKKRWNFEFYYPNNMNRFWKALSAVENGCLTEQSGPPAVEERKRLMQYLRVGVQNLGKIITRKNQSALDKHISILEFQDIQSIILGHPLLERIFLPGYSGNTSTYRSFIRYLKLKRIAHSVPEQITAGMEFTIQCGRPILCIIGNSTSLAARSVRFEDLVNQFKNAIVR